MEAIICRKFIHGLAGYFLIWSLSTAAEDTNYKSTLKMSNLQGNIQ